MDPLDIARWQFGITTVYHFLMVPLTIGLGMTVVIMHTQWVRTRDERWLRMTKFWGKLYLVNFILGVATGLVQEFQFGMAWSEYSRFVGAAHPHRVHDRDGHAEADRQGHHEEVVDGRDPELPAGDVEGVHRCSFRAPRCGALSQGCGAPGGTPRVEGPLGTSTSCRTYFYTK